MKNIKEILKDATHLSAAVLLMGTLAVSCGNDNDDDDNGGAQRQEGEATGALGPDAVQVERLARPAINEGLIISNDLLNAFNQVPPSADLSDAAAPVRTEAVTVIDAFDAVDGKDDTTAEGVATAFLPDVMRIDTTVDIAPGKTAYNADVSGDKGILTGGRKIEDDVIDITLSFLVAGDATGQAVKDNVSYSQVHKLLYRQSARGGRAQFPFLATPY